MTPPVRVRTITRMTILSGPSVGLPSAHGGLEVHAIRVSSGLGNVAGIRAAGDVLTVHRRALNLWLGGRLVAVVGGSSMPLPAGAAPVGEPRGLTPLGCPPFGLVISG